MSTANLTAFEVDVGKDVARFHDLAIEAWKRRPKRSECIRSRSVSVEYPSEAYAEAVQAELEAQVAGECGPIMRKAGARPGKPMRGEIRFLRKQAPTGRCLLSVVLVRASAPS